MWRLIVILVVIRVASCDDLTEEKRMQIKNELEETIRSFEMSVIYGKFCSMDNSKGLTQDFFNCLLLSTGSCCKKLPKIELNSTQLINFHKVACVTPKIMPEYATIRQSFKNLITETDDSCCQDFLNGMIGSCGNYPSKKCQETLVKINQEDIKDINRTAILSTELMFGIKDKRMNYFCGAYKLQDSGNKWFKLKHTKSYNHAFECLWESEPNRKICPETPETKEIEDVMGRMLCSGHEFPRRLQCVLMPESTILGSFKYAKSQVERALRFHVSIKSVKSTNNFFSDRIALETGGLKTNNSYRLNQ